MAARLGQIELAAHAVVASLGYFLWVLPFGVSIASSIRVGNLLGENDPQRARIASRATGKYFMDYIHPFRCLIDPSTQHAIACDLV